MIVARRRGARPTLPSIDGVVTSGTGDPGQPRCEFLQWAASGCMMLTGRPDGPPLAPTGAGMIRAQEMADHITRLTSRLGTAVEIDLREALSGRAALGGLRRAGHRSANGTCRLLRADDGWVAVNLARADDIEALPAVVGRPVVGDPWAAVAAFARSSPTAELVDRAQLVGIPASTVGNPASTASTDPVVRRPPVRVSPHGHRLQHRRLADITVVDLSSLWAGPLCAHWLGLAGARVLTVESAARPDGARIGSPDLHRWLHLGHQSVVLDFSAASGRKRLADLLSTADIVIESSRPRALEQLGVGPAAVASRDGRTWLSITGYGRASDRVAFGDDAAVAGGLVAYDEVGPVFCGDALADPLSGLAGTEAVLMSVANGGGELLDLSMRDVARSVAEPLTDPTCARDHHTIPVGGGRWRARCGVSEVDVADPRAPVHGKLPTSVR